MFFRALAHKMSVTPVPLEIIKQIKEDGAEERTIVLHIWYPDYKTFIGSYGWSYKTTGWFRYHDGGMVNPTIQVALSNHTFKRLFCREISPSTAWRTLDERNRELLKIEAIDNKPFYHLSVLMKLFDHMRKFAEAML